ncbi:response regulator [candidate division KSB3 bacterium]|uniref:Response regulator n=1 Tax=candidate division KSB3 bacterium TaxID=2044937 RepID=A0A9D5JYH6_9BACT|nr:response regulator [candidate division KSB3 bacterium]MBD3326709.1 response regulator [candidate division KSB3 bacterium]
MATILAIDDSEDVRNLVKQVLSEEHDVLVIDSWVHATEYIFKHEIDLILLDINMPGLSGDKLAEVLMRSVKSKPLNIVLFSSIDEADLRQRAQEVGAVGYIPKTFDANLLRSRVRRFLKKIQHA